jgi:hypothetical protein
MLSPLQAMVRSTSRRSDPLSIIHTASGGLAHYPRVLCTRADLIADTQGPVANKSVANSYPAGQPTDGRLTLDPGPVPASPGGPGHSLPATLPRAPTITVRVMVIICSAIGGAILVASILAFVYVVRIRRRVRRIQGCTNVLGPGASLRP